MYSIHVLQYRDYQLGHRENLQLDHRENKAYTLGLSQLSIFIVVTINTDGFFSYQCIRFIFSMIELRYDRHGTITLIKYVLCNIHFYWLQACCMYSSRFKQTRTMAKKKKTSNDEGTG